MAVKTGIPHKVPPESNPVHSFKPTLIQRKPFFRTLEDGLYSVSMAVGICGKDGTGTGGRINQIVGVPQQGLALGRIKANFQHIAGFVTAVAAAAVPDPVMHHQQGSRRADHMLLAKNILVTGNSHFINAPKMAAGNIPGATHIPRHRMGVVHDLDIKSTPPRIDNGIGVSVLSPLLAGWTMVNGVMVKGRFGTHQALDNAAHCG